LWELPQSCLGAMLLAWLYLRGTLLSLERLQGGRYLCQSRGIAISLGLFVFWARFGAHPLHESDRLIRAHELGHTVQSRRWSWLYIPTVGICSVSRVLYSLLYARWNRRLWTGYFDGWPENEADWLGSIRRDGSGRRVLLPGGCPMDCPLPRVGE
jgi:hypothetical protein